MTRFEFFKMHDGKGECLDCRDTGLIEIDQLDAFAPCPCCRVGASQEASWGVTVRDALNASKTPGAGSGAGAQPFWVGRKRWAEGSHAPAWSAFTWNRGSTFQHLACPACAEAYDRGNLDAFRGHCASHRSPEAERVVDEFITLGEGDGSDRNHRLTPVAQDGAA
jgi:hypothetical protein